MLNNSDNLTLKKKYARSNVLKYYFFHRIAHGHVLRNQKIRFRSKARNLLFLSSYLSVGMRGYFIVLILVPV